MRLDSNKGTILLADQFRSALMLHLSIMLVFFSFVLSVKAMEEETLNTNIFSPEMFFRAVKKGYAKALNYFIDQGTNIHIRDKDGNIALLNAARNGHKEIVELVQNYLAKK